MKRLNAFSIPLIVAVCFLFSVSSSVPAPMPGLSPVTVHGSV